MKNCIVGMLLSYPFCTILMPAALIFIDSMTKTEQLLGTIRNKHSIFLRNEKILTSRRRKLSQLSLSFVTTK